MDIYWATRLLISDEYYPLQRGAMSPNLTRKSISISTDRSSYSPYLLVIAETGMGVSTCE